MNAVYERYLVLLFAALSLSLFFGACQFTDGGGHVTGEVAEQSSVESANDTLAIDDGGSQAEQKPAEADEAAYKAKLLALANGDTTGRWPVANQPQPLPGVRSEEHTSEL